MGPDVALAREASRRMATGAIPSAREKLEECVKLLLNRGPATKEFDVRVLPAAQIGVLTNHEIVIERRENGSCLYVPDEILKKKDLERFINRFEVVRKICTSGPVLAASAGWAVWDLGDASRAGDYARIAFCSNLENAQLIADSYFLAASEGYRDLRAAIRSHWIPWDERKQIVFWRGSTTGERRHKPAAQEPLRDWRWLQRLHLCDWAVKSRQSQRLDIGVVERVRGGFAQIPEKFLARRIRDAGFLRQRAGKLDFLRYRYIVDIDGNASAWSGLFTAMLLGATIFKVASPFGFRQWYYGKLAAWENYIPVKADLTDFDEQIDWAFSHPRRCAEMGEAIKGLADRLTYEKELQHSTEVVRQALANGAGRSRGGNLEK
jgi:Glycosyl transferase family 90